ncbi:MAG: histidine phosphatase family protein [Lentisphaeria bacterium]|nr:histidine phosphatase family protein [Lentisphaeria bacterium]NQZ67815.1 histidine phosphatase family protein [Lentisphaeria bacterium]
MNLLIVRHAESKGNATGNYSALDQDSLSDLGQTQAPALAASLQKMEFDKIIVSPLQRTLETLSPYLELTNQHAEIWPEIAEACAHKVREEASDSWETQTAELPDTVASPLFSYRNYYAIKPARIHTFGEALRRVYDALELLQELSRANESVLMLTHGHFIRELINLMLDTPKTIAYPHDNCGMTLMKFDGTWSMDFCNR